MIDTSSIASSGLGLTMKADSRLAGCLGVGLLILPILIALADTPLPPPQVTTAISRNLEFEAESSPQTNETIVYRQNRGPRGGSARGEPLWKFPRWFRAFQISNDGSVIVAEDDYLNLLPSDVARDDYVLLTFIVRGRVVREITVKQLLGSHSKLEPTASHLSWGRGLYGIDDNGFVLVDTVVGFFIFDAHTGKCIFPTNNNVDPCGTH
jgi:hypothetical protein